MIPEELQELCALYVLDALEPQEAEVIEARLRAGDPEVHREVMTLREVVDLLPYTLSAQPPSPAVRAQLMARIQATGRDVQTSQNAVVRRDFRSRFGTAFGWLPALAAAVLVLVSGWLLATWRGQGDRVTTQLEQLRAQVAEQALLLTSQRQQFEQLQSLTGEQMRSLAAQLQQLQSLTAEHTQLLADMKIATVSGTEHAPNAGALVFWDTRRNAWTVITHDLPPLPPGKIYQLWFLASGPPIPSKIFRPPATGQEIIQTSLPPAPTEIAGAAVSVEPAGGVPQPTGNLVLVGKF